MQDLFVPLAIHNNKGGEDKRVLEHYKEPAWNNPVVRFFRADRTELLPRKDGVWSAKGHVERMLRALEQDGRPIPEYLRIAQQELSGAELERAVFSMACYWKGEAFFGGLEGVHQTSAGWFEGDEVVEVLYDPLLIDLSNMVGQASSNSCANRVWVGDESQLPAARRAAGDRVQVQRGSPRDAKTSDRKFHLRRSDLNFLDLTPLQATRANSLLERRQSVDSILSMEQRLMLQGIRAALAKDSQGLAGLERPTLLSELPAYRSKLRERLAKFDIKGPSRAR